MITTQHENYALRSQVC